MDRVLAGSAGAATEPATVETVVEVKQLALWEPELGAISIQEVACWRDEDADKLGHIPHVPHAARDPVRWSRAAGNHLEPWPIVRLWSKMDVTSDCSRRGAE